MTLSRDDIIERLKIKESGLESIIVTPILDIEDQLGPCGLDVRLGKQFIIFKEHFRESLPNIDDYGDFELNQYQEEIIVPIKSHIILHPGKLIIGSTFEYVSIPPDLECQVEGRSSWARMGLVIATATTVEPCYKGVGNDKLISQGSYNEIPIVITNRNPIPVTRVFPIGGKIA